MGEIPDRWKMGNLLWTRTGDVFAMWRLEPLPRARTEEAAQEVENLHTHMWAALEGHEALLQGLLVWSTAEEIADRLLDGVDEDHHPEWIREAQHAVPALEADGQVKRRYYLTVKLRQGLGQSLKNSMSAAGNQFLEWAGMSPIQPAGEVAAAMLRAAGRMQARLPEQLNPTPTTPAELTWLRRHAQLRVTDFIDPVTQPEMVADLGLDGAASVGQPIIDEGAIDDLGTKGSVGTALDKAGSPLTRRYLKVTTADEAEGNNYQSGLVLSDLPAMRWPLSEFLGRIDDTNVPVDWAIALRVRSRGAALDKNRTAFRQLNDQVSQTGLDGDDSDPSRATQHTQLGNAAGTLVDYNERLANDKNSFETEPVIMVSVAATTAEKVDELAKMFQESAMFSHFRWERPVGAQEAIFWAMQPGGTITPQLRDYRQIALGRMLARTAPLSSPQTGDRAGIPTFRNLSALSDVIYTDLFAETTDQNKNHAPCKVYAGNQGSGKSTGMKSETAQYHARGARFLATDNSAEREWLRFADALDKNAALVDFGAPTASLDPLRVLPRDKAGPVAQAFLAVLLHLSASSRPNLTLSKVLKPGYMADHDINSMGALQHHLRHDCDLPAAEDLADGIEVYSDLEAHGDFSAAIFDPKLPPISLDARAIVIGTADLNLPSRMSVDTPHLFEQLSALQVFSRAVYALIAHLVDTVCRADTSDMALAVFDELHHMTRSRESVEALTKLIRDSRRSLAAVLVGSHTEADGEDERLFGLMPYRVVLRQSSAALAPSAASLLNVTEKESPTLYADIVSRIKALEGRGMGIYCGPDNVPYDIQTMLPYRPNIREVCKNTPTFVDRDRSGTDAVEVVR